MTDQPVQPEATTKAGQAMEAWLREPENYEWGRKVTNAILAIEAEARAASQERPQPDELDNVREQLERFAAIIEGRGEAQLVAPHGMTSNGPRRALERLAVAQERPQPEPQIISGYVNPDGSGEGNWSDD
jgi:hypothetical protein